MRITNEVFIFSNVTKLLLFKLVGIQHVFYHQKFVVQLCILFNQELMTYYIKCYQSY